MFNFQKESGGTLNSLEELLSAEEFDETEVEKVENVLQQLDFIDDSTAEAIGNLILIVSSNPELVKSSSQERWPSITGAVDEQRVKLSCLIEKSEFNPVEVYFQKFANSGELQSDEIEIIDDALGIISDLDKDSLSSIHELLKIKWCEKSVVQWPSITSRNASSIDDAAEFDDVDFENEIEKNEVLLWPSFAVN